MTRGSGPVRAGRLCRVNVTRCEVLARPPHPPTVPPGDVYGCESTVGAEGPPGPSLEGSRWPNFPPPPLPQGPASFPGPRPASLVTNQWTRLESRPTQGK